MESTYKFHKIDQTVSVLPSLVAVTAERSDLNVLGLVQLVQRLREQVHGVIDQGRLRLEKNNVTEKINDQSRSQISP